MAIDRNFLNISFQFSIETISRILIMLAHF
uniref:Uncharacterized protein n=1 Tax=Rhizophora mucronata TaxID=61149 RepID=A0A2P2KTX5_RHIMU